MKYLYIIILFVLQACSISQISESEASSLGVDYSGADFNDVVYRFNWNRSFHTPVIVTIGRIGENFFVESKMISLGDWVVERKGLSATEFYEFISFVFDIDFWGMVNPDFHELIRVHTGKCKEDLCVPTLSLDGASWDLEGFHQQKYRRISEHSPSEGAVREMGLKMIELSGIHNYGPTY